ncbi:MAG TPA: hypothetical protein VFR47_25510 [Anaerolineales bacterium]|nr:hypothetical protein [Anaerolineales bacterium]
MKPNASDPPGDRARLSLWDRVNQDPRFLSAKRPIQARFGLPLPYDIRLDYQRWLEWQGRAGRPSARKANRRRAFAKDIHELFKKFEVPEAWHIDFLAEIAGTPSDAFSEAGNLRINYYQAENGDLKWECIITPETDLTNPAVLKFIQGQQKEFSDPPPRPASTQAGSRKLDWRPLYEWHQRYPLFSIEEIAEKIEYPPETVRRKFRELRGND